jgi:translation initiation factor IF-2
MSKVRVYEVAKQLNLDPKAVVSLFQQVGVNEVRNHMSSVEPEAVERVKRHLEKQKTHDVVEERIRATVIKRRAIAKPGGEAPSSPSRRSRRPRLRPVISEPTRAPSCRRRVRRARSCPRRTAAAAATSLPAMATATGTAT